MSKEFACGDVVDGCSAKFKEADEKSLFEKIAEHAKSAHGIAQVPAELLAKVKAKIKDVTS